MSEDKTIVNMKQMTEEFSINEEEIESRAEELLEDNQVPEGTVHTEPEGMEDFPEVDFLNAASLVDFLSGYSQNTEANEDDNFVPEELPDTLDIITETVGETTQVGVEETVSTETENTEGTENPSETVEESEEGLVTTETVEGEVTTETVEGEVTDQPERKSRIKIKEVKYGMTVIANIGNYENIRTHIEATAEVEENSDFKDCIYELSNQIRQIGREEYRLIKGKSMRKQFGPPNQR